MYIFDLEMLGEESKPYLDWLSQYRGSTFINYKAAFKMFYKWQKKTDVDPTEDQLVEFSKELVKEYRDNPIDFSKNMGKFVIKWQNVMLDQGVRRNTARLRVMALRSFFQSETNGIKVKNGVIAAEEEAYDEHQFSLEDLRRMFKVGDLKERTILVTAVSLGWGVADFSNLKRDFVKDLVNKAVESNEKFYPFDWERGKEKSKILGILNPDALEYLAQWLAYNEKYGSTWLWGDGASEKLDDESFSEIMKRLVERAQIKTTGKIRFHLIRKYVMDSMSRNMNAYEVKLLVGKKIPISEKTYLRGLKNSVFEKYIKAYPTTLCLSANGNNVATTEKIKNLEAEVSNSKEILVEHDKEVNQLKAQLDESKSKILELDRERDKYPTREEVDERIRNQTPFIMNLLSRDSFYRGVIEMLEARDPKIKELIEEERAKFEAEKKAAMDRGLMKITHGEEVIPSPEDKEKIEKGRRKIAEKRRGEKEGESRASPSSSSA